MHIHFTFARYIGKQFMFWWFSVFALMAILILLFDAIELLRITASATNVSFGMILSMVLFKLPGLMEKAIPFTILFGGMTAFWRLNRHQEFVVARAAGVSAWEFLLPAVVLALTIGVIQITLYGPFASTMMLKFEQLQNQHIKGKRSLAALSPGGIWFKQSMKNGHYILHGAGISSNTMTLRDTIVFQFDKSNRFFKRVDASSAQLVDGRWIFSNVKITGPQTPVGNISTYELATDLTQENIQDSFAKPETISIWQLPGFLEVLEKAGFSGLRHRIYFFSLLATPLLLCSMTLFAGAFTLRQQRRGGALVAVALGVCTGFLIYFGSDVVYALGVSSHLPPLLAAWSPPTIALLLGAGLLFHMEDG